jgi:hypothetical protein
MKCPLLAVLDNAKERFLPNENMAWLTMGCRKQDAESHASLSLQSSLRTPTQIV